MDSNYTIIVAFIALVLAVLCGIYAFYKASKTYKITELQLSIKDKEVKNKQMELFMQMDPKLAEQEIDDLVEKYMNEYVLKKLDIQSENQYRIRKEIIDKMAKEISKSIIMDLSELYLFYIKMIININDDDDLFKYIYKKVSDHVMIFAANRNTPK
jgi:hypothetical protein